MLSYIVSGDGEDALSFASNPEEAQKTDTRPTYRNKEKVLWNKSDAVVDLNTLPIPSATSSSIKILRQHQVASNNTINITDGSPWKSPADAGGTNARSATLTFSIPATARKAPVASPRRSDVSDEHRMMDFQLIGNTLPKTEYRILFEKLRKLGIDF